MAVAGGPAIAGAIAGSALVLLLRTDSGSCRQTQRGAARVIVFSVLHLATAPRARPRGLRRALSRDSPRRRERQRRGRSRGRRAAGAARCRRGSPLLTVTGAVKRFGGLVAVDHVNFAVDAGEIVGLIGPNGAGKSTMFNL
jgi:branched-chain amino acid transport system permease protein